MRLPIRFHRTENNQIPVQFLSRSVTKEICAKKIRCSCGLGALKIIFTCAHRRSVDGRIRALIKLMQPRSTSVRPNFACTRLAYVSVNTDQGDFYERYTLWKRCRRVPTGTSSHRPLLTSTFLADWFEEKCGLNLETVFSIFSTKDFDDSQTTA